MIVLLQSNVKGRFGFGQNSVGQNRVSQNSEEQLYEIGVTN